MLDKSNNPLKQKAFQHIGASPERREDEALVKGAGCFTSDLRLDDALSIAFVRSTIACANLVRCDVSGALEGGAAAAFCGRDLPDFERLSVNAVMGPVAALDYPILAREQIIATGQPVAAVLAQCPQQAATLGEQVNVEFDEAQPRLELDCSADDARKPFSGHWQQGDTERVFAKAELVVDVTVQHPRLAPAPMEGRAVAVRYEADRPGVTVWLSTQTPHRARSELARILGVDISSIEVISPSVGGAFGMKASLYPEEVFAVWAAFQLRRSVRWTASRSEEFVGASHGRGLETRGSLALDNDGRFLALRAEVLAPVGCWLTNSSAIPAWNAARILPGPYRIDHFDLSTVGVQTNTAPVGIYRGAGRPEAAMLMERLVERAARVLHIDPVELRWRNLLQPGELQAPRATGAVLDSGRYGELLGRLCETAGYDDAVRRRDEKRRDGMAAGLGGCFFVEPCGSGWETATVRREPDGQIHVFTGGSSQGHGRETALAQIAADVFQCPLDKVSVSHGDTQTCPAGIGALASRSTAIGGSAVFEAAQRVARKLSEQPDPSATIEEHVRYEAAAEAWGYGFYLAEVTIDLETGEAALDRLSCCDDAGRVINPRMLEGQLHGGIAQGIGEALMEHLHYDEAGQLLTGSLMDYALPRAADIPPTVLDHMETETGANLLGAKGVGEAGAIGAPGAIANAVCDALAPFGVDSVPLPMTSFNIWQALKAAAAETSL